MIDMQNQEEIPILEDFAAYIRNPVFMKFCSEIKVWEKPVYDISKRRVFHSAGCDWFKSKRSS